MAASFLRVIKRQWTDSTMHQNATHTQLRDFSLFLYRYNVLYYNGLDRHKNDNVCAIGDPDQAIYSFRGADSRFFAQFQGDFPNPKVVRLNRNYRSDRNIVALSSQVLAYDKTQQRSTPLLEGNANLVTLHEAPNRLPFGTTRNGCNPFAKCGGACITARNPGSLRPHRAPGRWVRKKS